MNFFVTKIIIMGCLETRQGQDFTIEYLEKKQNISNWYLAKQEEGKNIQMHEIKNIEVILLCSNI